VGLIYNSLSMIPFDYTLDRTTDLYRLMSTNPNDAEDKSTKLGTKGGNENDENDDDDDDVTNDFFSDSNSAEETGDYDIDEAPINPYGAE